MPHIQELQALTAKYIKIQILQSEERKLSLVIGLHVHYTQKTYSTKLYSLNAERHILLVAKIIKDDRYLE